MKYECSGSGRRENTYELGDAWNGMGQDRPRKQEERIAELGVKNLQREKDDAKQNP